MASGVMDCGTTDGSPLRASTPIALTRRSGQQNLWQAPDGEGEKSEAWLRPPRRLSGERPLEQATKGVSEGIISDRRRGSQCEGSTDEEDGHAWAWCSPARRVVLRRSRLRILPRNPKE